MTPIADYMTKDTKLPSYIPFPRFLLGADLTLTTQLLYALLLDRATLSQKSGWVELESLIHSEGHQHYEYKTDKLTGKVIKAGVKAVHVARVLKGKREPDRA